MGKKVISVTPKWHLLFCHIIPTLRLFRRVCHSADNPIERMHASDKHLSSQFCNRRNNKQHEDSKRNVLLINRHPDVMKEVSSSRTKRIRTFKEEAEVSRRVKKEKKAVVKLESRDNGGSFQF